MSGSAGLADLSNKLGPITANTADEKRRASLAIAHHSLDVVDAATLLQMLGLEA